MFPSRSSTESILSDDTNPLTRAYRDVVYDEMRTEEVEDGGTDRGDDGRDDEWGSEDDRRTGRFSPR